MNAIDRAIAKGDYKTSRCFNLHLKWQDFEEAIKNRKVIMFGIGEGAKFYSYKYKGFSKISMAVDNNKDIQKCSLQALIPDMSSSNEIFIEDPSVLERYRNSDVVVLITSLRFFDEIASELENYGIKKYYSVLCMEAEERSTNIGKNYLDMELCWLREMRKSVADPKKICIFPSSYGAGHKKEIMRHLLRKRSDIKITWLLYDMDMIVDEGIRKRPIANPYIYEHEYRTSGVWIGDNGGGFPSEIEKKDNQTGIELKHWSSITLKKFYLDEKMYSDNKKQKEEVEKNIKRIDYIMVGSKFDENTCRSGMGIGADKFVYVGSPRSDILFRNNRKDLFLIHYPYLVDKKLLLYAPTFRRTGDDLSGHRNVDDIDFDLIHTVLNERFPGDWNILLRLHPLVATESKKMNLPDYLIDVSDYPDAEELVAASDAVITDYSSIMFEPAYIKTPVFLLATDLENYTSQERDFYIDYETLPFPIAKNNEELRMNILSFDEEKYENDLDIFFDKYGVHEDGHAAERAAQFISDLIDKKVMDECH